VKPQLSERIALACDEMDATIRERTPDLERLMRETYRDPRFTEFLVRPYDDLFGDTIKQRHLFN
jgi:hypothetical protein